MAKDIQNKQVKALPIDENGRNVSGVVLPLIDEFGNVSGWAPVGSVDLPDGSVALKVEATLNIEDPDLDLGDIHLLNTNDNQVNPATEDTLELVRSLLDGQLKIASSNLQTSGNKFIKADSEGKIFVTSGGEVSAVNSTEVPLGVGGVFTGEFENTLDFGHIVVHAHADQESAVDGLEIQWSSDGVNVGSVDVYTLAANKPKAFTFGPQLPYFRIVYTNGSVAQSEMHLIVTKKTFKQKVSSHRITDIITEEDDVELVKSVLAAQTDAGNFLPIKASDEGFLRVVAPTPEAPPGTNPVVVTVQSNVSTAVNTIIPVTNGAVLTLQLFAAGSEQESGGSKVELFEDPNGDLSVLNLVSALYVNGNSDSVNLGDKFIGNGTRRLVIRRSGLSSSSAREIYASFRGFESL